MLFIVVVVSCVTMKIVLCSALSHEVLNSQHYKHSHAKCLSLCKCSSYTEQAAVSLRPQINFMRVHVLQNIQSFNTLIPSKLRH